MFVSVLDLKHPLDIIKAVFVGNGKGNMLGIKSSSMQKVVLAFSLLIACNEQTSVYAATLDCPINHDEPVLVPEGTASIELNIHAEGLCTLTRVTTLDGHKPFLTSVARSYSGYQWEVSVNYIHFAAYYASLIVDGGCDLPAPSNFVITSFSSTAPLYC